ncbi:MAG TPA: four helix bundle protein [Candidatus Moranbacteria bacterium]|nr:four helix bundle protein [Candidatus Moranbacteria bacterium]HRY28374.1 four helix bundle protein [Candidatus Moranbacteria bacterium]HSA08046.1 four helix bundle protein [Candidatus Moranbacteria bacterium]
MKNNLEERTTNFSKKVVIFLKTIKKDNLSLPLINQLVRSATSIGANYFEAGGSCSKKDFKNKIYICKKECRETKYWLEILAEAHPESKNICRELWKEAHELTLIFSKTILTLENKK